MGGESGNICKPNIKHYVKTGAVSIEDILYRAGGMDGKGKMPSRTVGTGLNIKDVNLDSTPVTTFEKDIGYSHETIAKKVAAKDFKTVSPLHYSWYVFHVRVEGYRKGDQNKNPDLVTDKELGILQSDASEKGLAEVAYQIRAGVALVHRLTQGKVGDDCKKVHEPEKRLFSEIKDQIKAGEFENVVEVMLALGGSQTGGFPNHQVDNDKLQVKLADIQFNSTEARIYEDAIGYPKTEEELKSWDVASATPLQKNWHNIRIRVKGFREYDKKVNKDKAQPDLVAFKELKTLMADATDAGIRQAVREMRATADLLRYLHGDSEAKVIHGRVEKASDATIKTDTMETTIGTIEIGDTKYKLYNEKWYHVSSYKTQDGKEVKYWQPLTDKDMLKQMEKVVYSKFVSDATVPEGDDVAVDGVSYKKFRDVWFTFQRYDTGKGEVDIWLPADKAPETGTDWCSLPIISWFCGPDEVPGSGEKSWWDSWSIPISIGGIAVALGFGRLWGQKSQKKKDITAEVESATVAKVRELESENSKLELGQSALKTDRDNYNKNLAEGIKNAVAAQMNQILKDAENATNATIKKQVDENMKAERDAIQIERNQIGVDVNEINNLKHTVGLDADDSVQNLVKKVENLDADSKDFKKVQELLGRLSGKTVRTKQDALDAASSLAQEDLKQKVSALEADSKAFEEIKMVLTEAMREITDEPVETKEDAIKAIDRLYRAGEEAGKEEAAPVSIKTDPDAKGGDSTVRDIDMNGKKDSVPPSRPSKPSEKPTSHGGDPLADVDTKLSVPMKEVVLPFLINGMGLEEDQIPDEWAEHKNVGHALGEVGDGVSARSRLADEMAQVYGEGKTGDVSFKSLSVEAAATIYARQAAAELDKMPDEINMERFIATLSVKLRKHHAMELLDGKLSIRDREDKLKHRAERRRPFHK